MKGCIYLITVCTLLLLGLQSSTAQYEQQDQCPHNEHEVDCVNPCHSCTFLNKTCPITTDECTQGCDCKTGFLRNKFGYCIPKRYCGAPELPAPTTEEEPTQDVEEVETGSGCPDTAKCNSNCQAQRFESGSCHGSRRSHCTCSESRLPVKGKTEVAESSGCPSGRICTLSCNRRGFKTGLCLGPGRGFCNCYTAIEAPTAGETPGNREVAESGGCPNARICTLSCNRRGFKTGLCLGPGRGFCNCYTAIEAPTAGETPGNRVVAESGGCPNARICTLSCNRRGFKTGLCLGPGRGFCNCYTAIEAPTVDGNPGNREVAESGSCPSARICTLSCERRGFKTGLCLGPGRGFCNCYTAIEAPTVDGTPGNREVAESGGCPNARICTLSCETRGFKSGLCLGPGLESCNCYTTLQVPAEGGSPGNREVADSGGCPSTLRCIRNCNRRNFETGVCLGPRRGFCNCYSSSSSRTHGCPQESLCITSCKRRGYVTGFCSGPRRLNCNCSGRIE